VATGVLRLVRGTTPKGRGSTVELRASKRRVYLDNLKLVLIVAVIAIHGPQRLRRVHGANRVPDRDCGRLRPVPLVAEGKAVVVAAGGIAASFGFAWILIKWVPGMARIL
jgi:hypothetical protein